MSATILMLAVAGPIVGDILATPVSAAALSVAAAPDATFWSRFRLALADELSLSDGKVNAAFDSGLDASRGSSGSARVKTFVVTMADQLGISRREVVQGLRGALGSTVKSENRDRALAIFDSLISRAGLS